MQGVITGDNGKIDHSGQRHQEVVLTITDTKNDHYFGRISNLQDRGSRNVLIRSIEIKDGIEVPYSSSRDVISDNSVYNNGFLVLKVAGEDKLNYIPLRDLDPAQNNGRVRGFLYANVDWERSYVRFPDETVVPAGPQALLFSVFYDLEGDSEKLKGKEA